MTEQQSDFVATLEALTKEPVWMTILGLAGEGLITLPDWARDKTVEALEEVGRKGPPKLEPEQIMRTVRRLQDQIAFCGGAREVFQAFIKAEGNKRPDGSLMTYREIAEVFGHYKTEKTYFNWMRFDFPDVAKAMREAHS
jgi:hypothetical protein